MSNNEALRMENITKVYPNGVMANRDVTLAVNWGEIHALSGENGAGKSTLMKILFGEEQPTKGEIFFDGQKVNITSPSVAISLGIGMVHQHFMLVDTLTVMENIILGIEPRKGLSIDRKLATKQVLDVMSKYNLFVEPEMKVADLTVGQKQKIEIVKSLVRGARILILDEPTAVLTPQETSELFEELNGLRKAGHTIIFISHKLGEVRALCDRITIIRRGQSMGVYNIKDIDEKEISRLMVGRDVVLNIAKEPPKTGEVALRVENLVVVDDDGKKAVDNVSFVARRGEILGVAGVEGNGQNHLVNAITRLTDYQRGKIEIFGQDIKNLSISKLRKLGVSHIPEDRMTLGVAPNLTLTENIIADKVDDSAFTIRGGLLAKKKVADYSEQVIKTYGIFASSPEVTITSLSGGNIQKAVLARELSSDPSLIIANQPTRGVDVGATEYIRKLLIQVRDSGKTVFLISSDLNEVLGLSDRLIVLYEGRINAFFPDASTVSEVELGRYMLGIDSKSVEEIEGATR